MIQRDLNPQSMLLEDAQTRIKMYLLKSYFSGRSKNDINNNINKIIDNTKKSLETEALKQVAPQSLKNYANALWAFLIVNIGINGIVESKRLKEAQQELKKKEFDIQKYAKDYIEKIRIQLNKYADIEAKDADDLSGLNSLRNKAEMEVRYEKQQNRIEELKSKGTKFVVSSVHADCSDRCFPWQGRIYSLDHTSGEIDNKKYVPLEVATDIFYTTKKGKIYKNGLLGFNCRHYLYEYKSGMEIPKISKEVQQKENKINTQQRNYELSIRKFRERALVFKDIDKNEYLKARQKAIEINKQYIEFSEKNNRTYYPDRIKLLD